MGKLQMTFIVFIHSYKYYNLKHILTENFCSFTILKQLYFLYFYTVYTNKDNPKIRFWEHLSCLAYF